MAYEIIWEQPKGVIKRYFGHISAQEILEGVEKVGASEHFDQLRYVISDFSECSALSISSREIDEISAIESASASSNANIYVALVGAHQEVILVLNTYANSPFNAYPTRIFDSIAAARGWLCYCTD